MGLKICPRCHRLSIDFDYVRREERCLYRDCNWVNHERIKLFTSYGEAGITPPYNDKEKRKK